MITLRIIGTTAAELRIGDVLDGDLNGRIVAIEHGPTMGIYLDSTGDARWLLAGDLPLTVRRPG